MSLNLLQMRRWMKVVKTDWIDQDNGPISVLLLHIIYFTLLSSLF